MLKALEHGKMARWELDDGTRISASEVYRDIEDHLTAAVIGRLVYLPNKLFWEVMSAAETDGFPEEICHQRPRVEEVQFWPRYQLSDTDDTICEPDVLIVCEDGIKLMVEAKRYDYDTKQTAKQIRNYIEAVNNTFGTNKLALVTWFEPNSRQSIQPEGRFG